MCGYASDKEYREAVAEYSAKIKEYQKLETDVERLQRDTEYLSAEYRSELDKADPLMAEALREKREAARAEMETVARKGLKKTFGEDFAEGKFLNAK